MSDIEEKQENQEKQEVNFFAVVQGLTLQCIFTLVGFIVAEICVMIILSANGKETLNKIIALAIMCVVAVILLIITLVGYRKLKREAQELNGK